MASQVDINLLAQQLRDAADLVKSLSKSLQDEILLNAKARIGFKKDIEHLCEAVAELRRVYSGNGQPSLEVRLKEFEKELESLRNNCQSEYENKTRKRERFWQFALENSPVILTWLGLAVWAIMQFYLFGRSLSP